MPGWSKQQYQRFIREAAKEGARVFFTAHAELRMRQRGISHQVALEVLRRGLLRRLAGAEYPVRDDGMSNGVLHRGPQSRGGCRGE